MMKTINPIGKLERTKDWRKADKTKLLTYFDLKLLIQHWKIALNFSGTTKLLQAKKIYKKMIKICTAWEIIIARNFWRIDSSTIYKSRQCINGSIATFWSDAKWANNCMRRNHHHWLVFISFYSLCRRLSVCESNEAEKHFQHDNAHRSHVPVCHRSFAKITLRVTSKTRKFIFPMSRECKNGKCSSWLQRIVFCLPIFDI